MVRLQMSVMCVAVGSAPRWADARSGDVVVVAWVTVGRAPGLKVSQNFLSYLHKYAGVHVPDIFEFA